MKTNHLLAAVAALLAVMLVLMAVQYSHQLALEDEVAALRAAAFRGGGKTVDTDVAREPVDVGVADSTRIGQPQPIGNDELLDAARERITELERVLNGQADVLEKLVAEAREREEARRKASMRFWGEEQATGAPDTLTAGDHSTAWAPAIADGGVEWLEAEFESPADLAKIVVRQTSNPGGIARVVAIGEGGAEIPIWAGEDPSKGQQLADTPFPVNGNVRANRVRVYVDTSKLSGWEEIDAMQITGRDGSTQWAKSTKASSTYASGRRQYQSGYLGRNQNAPEIEIFGEAEIRDTILKSLRQP